MTDNRATELLHELLIARGVEFDTDIDECCYDEPPKTTWDFVLCGLEMTVTATEFVDVEGKKYLEMDFHHAFTPDQAIAATLGSGTCKDLGGIGANGEEVFHCSKCGCILSLFDSDGMNTLCTSFICDYPRFCPECGCKVVDDVRD